MDIVEIATQSGMLVILDGRIGQQEYRSVHGSLQSLQRFATALLTFCEMKDVGVDSDRGPIRHFVGGAYHER